MGKDDGKRGRTSTPPPRAKSKGSPKREAKSPRRNSRSKAPVEEEQEFGGLIGTICIFIGSHALLFYMTSSLYGKDPAIFYPTKTSIAFFLCYHASQVLLARFMPGVLVKTNGLDYHCNGYLSFWATLAVVGGLHYQGIFEITTLVKEFPAFLTTAMILGDIYSVIVHCCYAKGWELVNFYEFFIGIGVHPRLGEVVDVKMVAETRVSWTLLFLISCASWVKSYQDTGTWLQPCAFMVLAHLLYGNACAKGEHFIPYTWDITTEKFGWMLCWWNLAGVPLLYCYQSLYLAKHGWNLLLPPYPGVYYGVLAVALVIAYWLWDECNYQKCYFKAEQRGTLIRRDLFPTFRHVEKPKYIKSDKGVLLIDGWYGKARKFHYTCDTAMALLWGLSCGFNSLLPYVYFFFFVAMITHRASRDEARCKEKYGATWDKYLKAVPYRFIPGVW
eukprot:TRINITY_DN115569_c0_g1_i1.p1 TRINITY_DN115569_c0_g1~~TRINITY_DN115569_c0_g1_i1.p1  ORF type:complete len:444 (+),score=64.31 TRINITY_DN115569_c0_g1_i1:86-1417(+)